MNSNTLHRYKATRNTIHCYKFKEFMMAEESKVYRVNPIFLKRIKKIWLETTIETKKKVEESDVVNAVLYKFLDQISVSDVKEYRREIKGKDD